MANNLSIRATDSGGSFGTDVSSSRLRFTAIVGIRELSRRKRVVRVLRHIGGTVAAVGDGVSIVQLLAEAILDDHEDKRPDVIVTDALLPGCTGLSLLQGLRALNWQTPFFLLTERQHSSMRKYARRLKVTACFTEPLVVRKLASAVERALASLRRKHRDYAAPNQLQRGFGGEGL